MKGGQNTLETCNKHLSVGRGLWFLGLDRTVKTLEVFIGQVLHRFLHTVVNLGAAVLRFREFSFRGIHIYPEYLIAYRWV